MTKLEIAAEHLEEALAMYGRGRFSAALTLAGAAEEVLGGLVKARAERVKKKLKTALGERAVLIARLKGTNLDEKKEKEAIIAFLNYPKNTAKHYLTKGFANRRLDWKAEANDRLEMAITNYRRATGEALSSETYYQFMASK